MNTPPSANFYDIIRSKEKKNILLADGGVFILKKLPFIKFLQYESYRSDFKKEDDPSKKLKSLLGILDLYGLDDTISATDMLTLFVEIVTINVTGSTFAWQSPPPDDNNTKQRMSYPTEYPGREVAYTVAILADVFSWDSNHVLFELTYDEVNAYIQEALLIRHNREKLAYNLSDVGYKTSSDGKSSEKIPYSEPYWMSPTAIVSTNPKTVNRDIYNKYMPNGVVIDLTDHETAKTFISKSEEDELKNRT